MILLIMSLLFNIESIPTPAGYKRVTTDAFGNHLRIINLKKDKTVYLYNGEKKINQTAQYAVLDIPVGVQDLQQCADAVMRLRAEYLCKVKERIVFYDNNGKGYEWKPPSYDKMYLQKYLEGVYKTCNSASLEKQMKPKRMMDMKIGDVLIKGGFPGHVVIVVDMAVNDKGEKVYMLAQSYMPAQDIHILKGEDGPWYHLKEEIIYTPEYTFYPNQLRSW
jgi:hypothetical protein